MSGQEAVRAVRPRPWLAVSALASREWTRMLRQRGRLIGVLAQSVVLLILLGGGLYESFRHPIARSALNYPQFLLPGVILLVMLFAAIFSTIGIIEDRTSGFLQGVTIAPIPAWALVLGHALGGGTLAVAQAAIMLPVAPILGLHSSALGLLGAIGVMLWLALTMTSLGIAMGWRMRSVQSYHTMMNLLLLPMWLLSGSIFPSAGAARWMQTVMAINPLTYGDAALRRMLYLGQPELQGSLPGLTLSIAVIAGFGLLSFGLAVVAVGGRNREGGP